VTRTPARAGLALGLAAACCAGAVAATPAAASTPSGCHSNEHYEVCFTDPATTAGGRIIEDRLGELVDSAHRGDTIRIALYNWSRAPLATKVVAAKQRGVSVKVVLDGQVKRANKAAYRTLVAGKVPITNCANDRGGCLGTGINHDKLFLFDIGGAKSVVLTSFNDVDYQLRLYNNLIRIKGDGTLYSYYSKYWTRLHDQTWYGWSSDADRTVQGSLARGFVFPRKKDDPILTMLNKVTACNADHRSVFVAESAFRRSRSALRHRLAALQKLGCDVRVVVQQQADEAWVQSPAGGGLDLANTKVRHAKVHHKFIAIDAKYNGKWQRVVETGSHNLFLGSLRNSDEATVLVRSGFVFDQYSAHFRGVYKIATNG
jgi:phosphatidylserine/phosphatidylglycerophosphate/cardiolipin synthase-like enzyme